MPLKKGRMLHFAFSGLHVSTPSSSGPVALALNGRDVADSQHAAALQHESSISRDRPELRPNFPYGRLLIGTDRQHQSLK
jgi:hypothetical protein